MKKSGSNPTTSTESPGRLTSITTADSLADGVVEETPSGMAHRYTARMIESIQAPDHRALSIQFEGLIDTYQRRGYGLSSWELSTVAAPGLGVLHTIVAVFKGGNV